MIRIKSRQDGFRRCGVAHAEALTEHADDAFTAEQLAVLKAEPMLLVEVIDDAKAAADKKTAEKAAA
jgi:hypothetical protein